MAVIRLMRLPDAVRFSLSKSLLGNNWAETRERLAQQGKQGPSTLELLRKGSRVQRENVSLVLEDGGRLVGLVSACRGPRSRLWEVDLLCLDAPDAQGCQELLEAVVTSAGSRGGHRVVLRLPAESDLVPQVCQVGFVPCVREMLYRSQAMPSYGRRGRSRLRDHPLAPPPSLPLRRRLPSDDPALFRLYCQALPSQVRLHQAWTLDQWRESHEGPLGAREELVWQVEGSAVAWVRLQSWGAQTMVELLLHPQWEEHCGSLVDHVVARKADHRLSWLVAEHQVSLARRLEERAFVHEGEYVLLVKPLTAPLRAKAVAPVVA